MSDAKATMQLHWSSRSPFVRKVMLAAHERGLDHMIERIPTVVALTITDRALLPHNPLGRIPTLRLADGRVFFDSSVICEYLDTLGEAPKLFPAAGPARWKALQQQALADGILDASQPRRREVALPQDQGRIDYIVMQQGKVARALDVLEAEADTLGMLATIGEITIGCALGYLDFRFPHEPWRPGHPKLEAWYAKVVALPPLAETMPPAG